MFHDDIDNILSSFNSEISHVTDLTELKKLNSLYLGKHGKINSFFKAVDNISLIEKKEYIKKINNIKTIINNSIRLKQLSLDKSDIYAPIDITMPGKGCEVGTLHIINQTIYKIHNFFMKYGFSVEEGHEIDNVYNNFDALNMSIDHPARDIKDTFYINNSMLLRTHTSNVQIHIMKKQIPPIKVLSYGKVYRRDYDITHTPMFHQIEGFIVNANISLSNLKFILLDFLKFFFNESVEIRFRASYFPFTEPSFEVDIRCVHCFEEGCGFCKYSGWIEILGCGVIHPTILKNCNINPHVYNGIAFGIGVERLTMIKHKMNDIKLFFENNLDFLKQF